LRVLAAERSPYPITPRITGKFAEHLGFNIYNGMEAQVLRNPTFAEYPFWTGVMSPDGITQFHWQDEKINDQLRRLAQRFGWPEPELDNLVNARADGLACFWTRVGPREAVQVSPDSRLRGARAQRVQVKEPGQGIAQWTWLPLHRQRTYEFEILARSPDLPTLTVTLARPGQKDPIADETVVAGLSRKWQKLSGKLHLGTNQPADTPYLLSITAPSHGQFVLGHVFLRPVDHINGADPDVVRYLRESRLPILRWPGGNFASTYHWDDGVGPIEDRPARPNYAWGGVEPNTFGTDEFVAFCRAVGCEPMICLNAGGATPAEAAQWVEYCNGPVTSPMGARRAANGHPEPYHIRYWEVGNELWGRWQYYWTTAAGYVDRYGEFVSAMLAADPTIQPLACGAPVLWGKLWNDTLIAGTTPILSMTTDHPLVGGDVTPTVDPLDIYRDFMAVPEVLENKWAALRNDMEKAGIKNPRLAVTELQMFAHLRPASNANAPVRLTQQNLVTPGTIAEALYDVLIYHAAIRLAPFVEMVTHSATVNHGGGLRKERERVYANPCHHAQTAFSAFANATPVPVELETYVERAPMVLPDLKNAVSETSFSAVDALAAVADDGSLLISLVHRGSAHSIRLGVQLQDFKGGNTAELHIIQADLPWAANTLEHPLSVKPVNSSAEIHEGKLELELRPYSIVRVRIPGRS
jgi:alpha-N-arabinofuranosidase